MFQIVFLLLVIVLAIMIYAFGAKEDDGDWNKESDHSQEMVVTLPSVEFDGLTETDDYRKGKKKAKSKSAKTKGGPIIDSLTREEEEIITDLIEKGAATDEMFDDNSDSVKGKAKALTRYRLRQEPGKMVVVVNVADRNFEPIQEFVISDCPNLQLVHSPDAAGIMSTVKFMSISATLTVAHVLAIMDTSPTKMANVNPMIVCDRTISVEPKYRVLNGSRYDMLTMRVEDRQAVTIIGKVYQVVSHSVIKRGKKAIKQTTIIIKLPDTRSYILSGSTIRSSSMIFIVSAVLGEDEIGGYVVAFAVVNHQTKISLEAQQW